MLDKIDLYKKVLEIAIKGHYCITLFAVLIRF